MKSQQSTIFQRGKCKVQVFSVAPQLCEDYDSDAMLSLFRSGAPVFRFKLTS